MGPEPTGHTHRWPPNDAASGTSCRGVEQYGNTGSSRAGFTPSARHCQLFPPSAAVSGNNMRGTEQYGNGPGTGVMKGGSLGCWGQSATPGTDPGGPELQTGAPPGSAPATAGQQNARTQNADTDIKRKNLIDIAAPFSGAGTVRRLLRPTLTER